MPPCDYVCKAEFWKSSKYVDFRRHLARPRNSFDIASSEGNVVHLKTISGSGADTTGGGSPFQLCLLNPTTILNATVVGLPFILAVVEVPTGWSMGLPPLAVRHVSMGKPLVVAGVLADVRIIMTHLQIDLAEEGVNQVSVMVYNTGSRNPDFTMMQSLMTIVTLTPIPRKVHCPLRIDPPNKQNLTIERNFVTPVILSNLHHLLSCRCTLRSVKAHYPASCVLRLFNGCWRF